MEQIQRFKSRPVWRVDLFLSQVPALFWVFMCIVAVFIFAYVYVKLPEDFYHSNIQFEPYIQEDASRLLSEIQYVITANVTESQDTTFPQDEWIIVADSVRVTAIDPEETEMTVTMSLNWIRHALPNRPSTMGGYSRFDFALKVEPEIIVEGDAENATATYYRYPRLSVKNLLPESVGRLEPDVLFPSNRSRGGLLTPIIGWSADVENQWVSYWSATTRGRPLLSSGQYERMLYYSAMTLIAGGSGDIQPITSRARVLTTSEALIGITLVGLFFNSLFHQNASSRPLTIGTPHVDQEPNLKAPSVIESPISDPQFAAEVAVVNSPPTLASTHE